MKSSTHSSSSTSTPTHSLTHTRLEQQRSPSPSFPPLPIFHEDPNEAALLAQAAPAATPYTGPDEGSRQYAAGLANKYLQKARDAAQLAKNYSYNGPIIVASSEKYQGAQGLARWAHFVRTTPPKPAQQAADGASRS